MTALVNNVKTALLLGAMIALLGVVGSIWGATGLVVGLALGGIGTVISYWFSDRIAIAAMRGRELTRETGGDLYRMVEDLSARAELPMPRLYLSPHQAPNAFATGRSPGKAAVCFTEGAVQLLNPDELRGVAAHELAHIKNRDTLISTVAALIAGVLSTVAWFSMWFGAGGRNANPLLGLLVIIFAAVGAALLKAMISRSREFVADADGARIAGTPNGLISALSKLESYSKRIPLNQPNPAQNNLFIIEPMMSNLGGGRSLTNLFATHPPTARRIAALRQKG